MNSDYRDLLAALNAAGASYLVVGGYALAVHAEPRFTRDLDVWIDADPANATRVWQALADFGAPLSELTPADLTSPELVFQIGVAPSRVDILTSIDGVTFAEAWPHRVRHSYGDQLVPFIGFDELVRNKRASGRAQDLADVELLEKHRPR
jgi:hypothetical protein